MKLSTLLSIGALSLPQLALGLLRKKFSFHCHKNWVPYASVCVTSLMLECLSAAASPFAALFGAAFHVIGGRLCVVGVTGSMGAGKSTLSTFLKSRGFTVIDADSIARTLLKPGTPAYRRVVKVFGQAIVDPASGEIDREALRFLTFRSDSSRKALNSIMHYYIIREMARQIVVSRLLRFQSRVVLDAALLFETGLQWICGPVIVLHVSDATQMERLMARDNDSPENLERMVKSQLPSSVKVLMGDVAFDNNSTADALFAQASRYFEYALGIFV